MIFQCPAIINTRCISLAVFASCRINECTENASRLWDDYSVRHAGQPEEIFRETFNDCFEGFHQFHEDPRSLTDLAHTNVQGLDEELCNFGQMLLFSMTERFSDANTV